MVSELFDERMYILDVELDVHMFVQYFCCLRKSRNGDFIFMDIYT